MYVILYSSIVLVVLSNSGHEAIGNWNVTENGQVCIKLKATILMGLDYFNDKDKIMVNNVEIAVPSTATSTEGSTCNIVVPVNNSLVPSQMIRLTFDKVKHPGWFLELYFTEGERFGADSGMFVLYTALISANYSNMADEFPNAEAGDVHHYYSTSLSPDGEPSPLAESIFTEEGYSVYCPSEQTFKIVEDDSIGFPAWIRLSNLQVQAYMTGKAPAFGDKDTCPMDQNEDDLLPIIVGSVLAGLIVITLVAYLIYRCRLPPEVINLTNPHSHFEDGTTLTRSGHQEDDESEESGGSVKKHRDFGSSLVHKKDASMENGVGHF